MKKAILLLSSLALLGGVGANIGVSVAGGQSFLTHRANASSPVDSLSFEDKYSLGSSFEVPSATFSDDGKDVQATSYLVFPSGKSVSSKKVTLSEAGQYRLYYRAYSEGKAFEKSFSFLVSRKLYTMNGEKSELYFGNAPYMEKEEEKGIVASISPYEEFVWNEPIDLSDYNVSKTLLSLNVTPASIGLADASKIIIKLTDRYDATNVVTIELKKCDDNRAEWAENNTYVMAYATGQLPTGLEDGQRTGPFVTYKGSTYKYHKNNFYGARIAYSMAGAPHFISTANPNYEEEYVRDQVMSIYFDYKSGVVYAGSVAKLVTDLKDATIQEGSPVWGGFTTGEAILSISAEGYNAERCTMLISKVADKTVSGYASNEFDDVSGPSIDIDFAGFDKDSLPYGIVNKAYPIFKASASDYLDGECEVKSEVYVNYGLSNQVSLMVENGSFTPKVPGLYTLVYRAKDKSGNETVLSYPLTIQASGETIAVDKVSKESGAFYSGSSVKVPSLTYKNARGKISETVSAKLVGKDVSYEVLDGEFTPLYAGEYEITYTFADYLYSGTHKETIKVSAGTKPSLKGGSSLPDYLILGCEYSLDALKGEDYSSGEPVEIDAEVYVKEGTSAKRKVEGLTYKPTTAGDLTLSYEIKGAKETTSVEYTSKIVDCGYGKPGELDIGAYFQGNASKYQLKNAEIEYFSSGKNDLDLSFINSLQAFDLSLRFRGGSLPNFRVVTITLTDSLDKDVAVDFTYRKGNDGNLTFQINDGTPTAIAGSFEDSKSTLIFSYKNATCAAGGASGSEKTVSKDSKGNAFAGFPSGKVYLSMKVSSLSDASSISLTNLSGQPLTAVKADLIKPMISASAERGERRYGDLLTLRPVLFGDVLDPNIKTNMKVVDPDGEIVTDDAGILLDGADPGATHEVTLNKYGSYLVTYSAEDNNENTVTYSYAVTVVDDIAPEVRLLSHATTGKVGEKIALAGIKVADNDSTEFTVYATVRTPDGRTITLGNLSSDGKVSPSSSFTPNQKGTYKVTYMIYDDSGNSVFVSYDVEVTE